jgi:hypothetical protein
VRYEEHSKEIHETEFDFRAFFSILSDIHSLKALNSSLNVNKSFMYLTKLDFVKAFGLDRTLIVAKDYKNIRLNFHSDNDSLLIKNQKNLSVKNVEIIGDVLRPTELKLVNLQNQQNIDTSLLFCLDEMANDEEASQITPICPNKQKPCAIGSKLNINLFRRRLKAKKFLELDETEKASLAKVLDHDRFKDKSIFHYIRDKQLVSPSDYENPGFIPLSQPSDSDYEQSYSQEAPSVHDLFDIEVDLDYEMVEEFLDEEEA